MQDTAYEEYIALSRYARYLPDEKRRETWQETVNRYVTNVVRPTLKDQDDTTRALLPAILEAAIIKKEILPSMRALMTAGEALDRDNTAGYNCSYLPVDDVRAFDEALYILMNGTGVGFSVERQYISKLPEIPATLCPEDATIVVEDSKKGWAVAYRTLLAHLYEGRIPKYDLSLLRPAGARLKTFGGRASGPEPLKRLFDYTRELFIKARGRKLNSYECHSIMCKIGESVVSGGVRRSALLSLSNLSDERMRHAKDGDWRQRAPELSLSNNSVAYTEKPEFGAFLREWSSLYQSYSGERGIFFRNAADKQVRRNRRREAGHEWGTNPCSEIILRPYQFCNLTSVVVRSGDSLQTLLRKVELATILGTVQATLTHFPYLRDVWKQNTEEERLLGVSFTGVMDHEVLREVGDEAKNWLTTLRAKAIATNEKYAKLLGINQAAAVTCVKPEGTVSQLTNSGSGLHPRHSRYYIRRIREDLYSPLSMFLASEGVPWEVATDQPNQAVFEFPIEAPATAVFREERSAIEQMEHWKMMQDFWCEHKPSITVTYKPEEFLGLGQWVWDHFDDISGVAFLPYDGGTYEQMPYEEIDEATYLDRKAKFPVIDLSKFREDEDNTIGSQQLACSSGSCEII